MSILKFLENGKDEWMIGKSPQIFLKILKLGFPWWHSG